MNTQQNETNIEPIFPNEENSLIQNALAMLWQEPFQYLKCYAEITDSIPAGWFLSWFSALCKSYEEMALSDADICNDLCISKQQWGKTRSLLAKKDILQIRTEKKQSFYSLKEDTVELLLRQRQTIKTAPKELELLETFFPSILCVNRLHLASLTALGVSLNTVILLAYLIDTLPAKPINEREPISTPILIDYENITNNTYLSKRQVSIALTELNKIGIVNTQENQDDKEKYVTINFTKLSDITLNYVENKQNNNNPTGKCDDEQPT